MNDLNKIAMEVLQDLVNKKKIVAFAVNGFSYEINLGRPYTGAQQRFERIESASGVLEWAKANFDVELPKTESKTSSKDSKGQSKKKSNTGSESLDSAPGVENQDAQSQ